MIASSKNNRDELKILGDAIVALLGVGVFLGVENKVPMSTGDFVTLTAINKVRQATNETFYPDRPDPAVNETDRVDLLFITLVVQIDCYGINADSTAQALLMLMRSDIMCEYGVTPLFCTEPMNVPFVNAEQQQQVRWSLDANLQFNVSWLQQQDSALEIKVDNFFNIDHNT